MQRFCYKTGGFVHYGTKTLITHTDKKMHLYRTDAFDGKAGL